MIDTRRASRISMLRTVADRVVFLVLIWWRVLLKSFSYLCRITCNVFNPSLVHSAHQDVLPYPRL